MNVTLVIPTYNEQENIIPLLENICSLSIPNLSVIIVDDNSPDGTASLVKNFSQTLPIHIIKRKGKMGLGSAYIAGFHKAISMHADLIFEMDADFSHDPDDIPRMIEAAKHADLVIGSRKIPGGSIVGWGWIRKSMSAGALWFSRTLLHLQARDVTSGFRCYKKHVLTSMNLDDIKSNGYAFQEEMLYRTQTRGYSIREIPVTFVDRQKGTSKLSTRDIIEFFLIIIKLRYRKK